MPDNLPDAETLARWRATPSQYLTVAERADMFSICDALADALKERLERHESAEGLLRRLLYRVNHAGTTEATQWPSSEAVLAYWLEAPAYQDARALLARVKGGKP
jgi:hypothetical protein